jgi:hypothetical protein
MPYIGVLLAQPKANRRRYRTYLQVVMLWSGMRLRVSEIESSDEVQRRDGSDRSARAGELARNAAADRWSGVCGFPVRLASPQPAFLGMCLKRNPVVSAVAAFTRMRV